MSEPVVSVIIPTRNRPESLRQTILLLSRQDLSAADYEIIVVDDGSIPPVTLPENTWGPRIGLIRLEGLERSAARGAGARLASGDLLLFLDDDMAAPATFVSAHLEAQKEWPGAMVVGAVTLPEEALATPFGRFRQELEQRIVPRERGLTGIPNFCTAANMSIPKTVFEKLGGFDPEIRSSEDQDLALRHSAAGGKIVFLPDARAVHNDRALNIGTYCKRAEWGSEHRLAFQRRYPEWPDCIEQQRVNGPISLTREPIWLSARKLAKSLAGHDPIPAIILRSASLVERLAPESAELDWLYRALLGIHLFRGHRKGLAAQSPAVVKRASSSGLERTSPVSESPPSHADPTKPENRHRRKPDLFIVGAPKCGTTSMYDFLQGHPEVFMCPVKEPHYFGSDLSYYPGYICNLNEYLSLFDRASDQKIVGEASTWLLYSKRAADEIKAFNPSARIIIMLRNPVEMMYALYSQRLFDCNENIFEFEAALEAEADRRRGERMPVGFAGSIDVYLYREVAKYSHQVQRYLEAFSRDMIEVVIFDDLQKDARLVFRRICEFLGIDPEVQATARISNANKKLRSAALGRFLQSPPELVRSIGRALGPAPARRFVYDALRRLNTRVEARTPLSSEIAAGLCRELAPDVDRLSVLLGRDLTHWTAPAGLAPRAQVAPAQYQQTGPATRTLNGGRSNFAGPIRLSR